VYEVAVAVEQPAVLDGETSANMQQAVLEAVKMQLQEALGDPDAASAVVANAALGVASAPSASGGSIVYTFTVDLPAELAARRRGRALVVATANLGGFLGFLMLAFKQAGVPDVDALFDSGAVSVNAGLKQPPGGGAAPGGDGGGTSGLLLGLGFTLPLIAVVAAIGLSAWARKHNALCWRGAPGKRGSQSSPSGVDGGDNDDEGNVGGGGGGGGDGGGGALHLRTAPPAVAAADVSFELARSPTPSRAPAPLRAPSRGPPSSPPPLGSGAPLSPRPGGASSAPRSLSPFPAQELFVSNFFVLLAKGDVDGVAVLLERMPALANASKDGEAPLHAAVRANSLPLVQLLVEAGADLHKEDAAGRTAEEAAAADGRRGVAVWLESAALPIAYAPL
jgi:hypothetical protein